MTGIVRLEFRSTLKASAERVWNRAISLDGINAETMPVFRMTAPPGVTSLSNIAFEPGKPLFRSRILALGFIPFDWTDLRLVELTEGRGFVERSTMGSMHSWEHIRRIEPDGDGCILTDTLAFAPRLPRAIARPMIRLTFLNRHRNLRRIFGSQEPRP